MCGIVAYVGRKIAQPLLIEGLKRLEYRGYDSAGIAVLDRAGAMHIRRAVGRISVVCIGMLRSVCVQYRLQRSPTAFLAPIC